MAEKKYVGVEALIRLVAQVKTGFASMVHKHEIKDIEDYVVDAALSDTSTNPVENKAIQAEFQIITDVLTSKADKSDLINGSFVVKNAEHANTTDLATDAQNAAKATQDASGNVITSTYETKTDASAKLAEAKSYADSAATTVKNDLLNGAGEAYDTLKELGELIDDNKDAIDALEDIATSKANASHPHGNITNAGAIGTVANKAIITTTNGVLTTGIVPIASGGTGATTAAEALTSLGMPATATVGQTAVVKAIDGNGMPIEWEAADLGKITIDENGDAWFGSLEEIYKIPEGLPDYTAEDEGKILSVVNGDAAWTENTGGSGGGGGIVVSETEPIDESVIFWVQI